MKIDNDIEANGSPSIGNTASTAMSKHSNSEENKNVSASITFRILHLFFGTLWLKTIEKYFVQLYTIIILIVFFVTDFLGEDEGYLVYISSFLGLVIGPNLLFFAPLQGLFLGSFRKSELRDLISQWRMLWVEIGIQVLLFLSIVPFLYFNSNRDLASSKEGVGKTCRAATVLVLFQHMISFLTVIDKQGLLDLVAPKMEGCPILTPLNKVKEKLRAESLSEEEITESENLLTKMSKGKCLACARAHGGNSICSHQLSMVCKVHTESKNIRQASHKFVSGPKVLSAIEEEELSAKKPNFISAIDKSSSTASSLGDHFEDDMDTQEDSNRIHEYLDAMLQAKENSQQAFKFLLKLLRRVGFWYFIFFLCAAAVSQSLISLIPLSVANVIAAVAKVSSMPELEDDLLNQFMVPVILILLNYLLIPVCDGVANTLGFYIGGKVESNLKTELFRQVAESCVDCKSESIESSKLQTMTPGDLASRFSKDTGDIGSFLRQHLYSDFGKGIGGYAVSTALLASLDFRMAFFFAIAIPVMMLIQSTEVTSSSPEEKNAPGRVLNRFQNFIKLRRTFNLYRSGSFVWSRTEPKVFQDFTIIEAEQMSRARFQTRVNAWANLYITLLTLAFLLSIIKSLRDGDNDDTVHNTALGLQVIQRLFTPTYQLSRGGQIWLKTVAALNSIEEVIHKSDASQKSVQLMKDSSMQSKLSANFESMALNDIHFTYPATQKETLMGVTTTFEAGEYTCIVGESGAGKSTLLNIITREAIESKGAVSLDGVKAYAKDTDVIRNKMGIVTQEATFFDGSIRDNVQMGRPDATEADINLALKRAQCDDLVARLKRGLDTELGALGEEDSSQNLSGGEAQRIALARALVRNPHILILDEATSALDRPTESAVIDVVKELAHEDNVAVVSVTHRLHTTNTSDKIVVLDGGMVVEEGCPVDLNKRGTHLYRMKHS